MLLTALRVTYSALPTGTPAHAIYCLLHKRTGAVWSFISVAVDVGPAVADVAELVVASPRNTTSYLAPSGLICMISKLVKG